MVGAFNYVDPKRAVPVRQEALVRHIHIIGIGAGDPDYLTVQAIEALNDTQVFFAMDKGESKNDLVALRREICTRFIRAPGYRFVELPDPKRLTDADYREAVSDWHAARARIWASAISAELGLDEVGAFLAWGDPSLYDSTLRILDDVAADVGITYDVIPGISAMQALTARHRIPLNEVGEPVVITTGRQLRTRGLCGSAVVMLDADCSFQVFPADTRIWWGAYLGTDDELLIAGTIGEVGPRIAALRAAARARCGWIMDIYLLRAAAAGPA
ncbi:precorrin-6A synthase (deacetylating) [Mycobacterium haemophilum]|uniref:Precorrin 6A synthase n=1 Tax=Mycobacterium haemophilum TaxID=29311 RepID=A0A0I9VIH7_9MYCO|nr:precorrin-6A synthase (deacetylating) [Mycobacterium haemophilum]KLO32368.1 precorrin 6A synthase [Mycobacterium haemophilum]KLO38581.1 precorrin 6A synthase [Mycobacterium haemophilum]KLO44916.1 precorrin 6A synthase [Mycobacterium haemophilum]KLO56258.1 precorrin 6A synthase [Mycobacterium haemophilum]